MTWCYFREPIAKIFFCLHHIKFPNSKPYINVTLACFFSGCWPTQRCPTMTLILVFYNLSPNIFGIDCLISWESWGYGAPLGRPSPRRQFIKFIFYFILHHIRNMYVHTSLHTTYIDDICTNVSWYTMMMMSQKNPENSCNHIFCDTTTI